MSAMASQITSVSIGPVTRKMYLMTSSWVCPIRPQYVNSSWRNIVLWSFLSLICWINTCLSWDYKFGGFAHIYFTGDVSVFFHERFHTAAWQVVLNNIIWFNSILPETLQTVKTVTQWWTNYLELNVINLHLMTIHKVSTTELIKVHGLNAGGHTYSSTVASPMSLTASMVTTNRDKLHSVLIVCYFL